MEDTGMKKATHRAYRFLTDIVGLYVELALSASRLVPGRS